jgi:hypothetical protein
MQVILLCCFGEVIDFFLLIFYYRVVRDSRLACFDPDVNTSIISRNTIKNHCRNSYNNECLLCHRSLQSSQVPLTAHIVVNNSKLTANYTPLDHHSTLMLSIRNQSEIAYYYVDQRLLKRHVTMRLITTKSRCITMQLNANINGDVSNSLLLMV